MELNEIEYDEFVTYHTFKDGSKMVGYTYLFLNTNSKGAPSGLSIETAQDFLNSTLAPNGELNKTYEYKISALYQDQYRSNLGGFTSDLNKLKIIDPRVIYKVEFRFQPKIFQLIVYVRRNKKNKKGGTTSGKSKNACLFNCICEAMKHQKYFKYDNQLKKFLGVDKEDKVSYKLLPKLEDEIKANIYLVGDHTYTSAKTYAKVINMKLEDGHYSLIPHNSKQLLKAVSHTKKTIIFYYKTKNLTITTYNGIEEITEPLTLDKIIQIREATIKHKSSKIKYMKAKPGTDIKEQYNTFMEDAKDILEATNGKINLFKNPTFKGEALRIFYNCSKCINPEPLTPAESLFHEKAFKGGLRYTKKGTYENCAGYDVNKQYTHILTSDSFKIPIKQGEFIQLTTLPEYLNYGIYRAHIQGQTNIFKFNSENYYSHFDIKRALQLGLNVELIQDGQANALIYKGNKTVSGAVMFKPYFDYVGKYMKDIKAKTALKKVINILWGALMQKNTQTFKSTSEHASAYGNIHQITPMKSGTLLITYQDINKPFIYDYARVGCFLTSKARALISSIVEPFGDKLIYLHTDGFVIEGEHDKPALGDKIGELKQDKYFNKCEVSHIIRLV